MQEQQRRSAAPPQRASAHTRGGDPISLSDGASSAERAMVRHMEVSLWEALAHQWLLLKTAMQHTMPRRQCASVLQDTGNAMGCLAV